MISTGNKPLKTDSPKRDQKTFMSSRGQRLAKAKEEIENKKIDRVIICLKK